jgi:hypothetical protein
MGSGRKGETRQLLPSPRVFGIRSKLEKQENEPNISNNKYNYLNKSILQP